MLSIVGRSYPSRPRAQLAVLASCLVAAVYGAPAAAADPAPIAGSAAVGSGTVTLKIGGQGKAATALAERGVKYAALAPAKKRGQRVRLPVQRVTVGKSASVALRGGVRFKAGERSLTLRSVRVKLTSAQATISAKAGKRRVGVFVAKLAQGKARLDRADVTAKLAVAKLGLAPTGARLLRGKLGLDSLPAGGLGRLAIDARSKSGAGRRGPAGEGPGAGAPVTGPITYEPPVLARPASAVDVTSASMTWRPRESWIQYINGGDGTSVFGGATNGPSETKPGHSQPLVYSFAGFPFKNGWYDPATGVAGIYFQGGVGFRWSAHGINFSAANPEIEINGGTSRAIFLFNGTENTRFTDQRGVLVDLDPTPIQTPPGGTITYSDVPGRIPADTGASVFAGFYPADAPFGTITVSFTTQ